MPLQADLDLNLVEIVKAQGELPEPAPSTSESVPQATPVTPPTPPSPKKEIVSTPTPVPVPVVAVVEEEIVAPT